MWLDPIAVPHTDVQQMTVSKVRFAPGARTAWHAHARGQYLHATQGWATSVAATATIIQVHAGQTLTPGP